MLDSVLCPSNILIPIIVIIVFIIITISQALIPLQQRRRKGARQITTTTSRRPSRSTCSRSSNRGCGSATASAALRVPARPGAWGRDARVCLAEDVHAFALDFSEEVAAAGLGCR